jgi:hypothetical protein
MLDRREPDVRVFIQVELDLIAPRPATIGLDPPR